MVKTKVSKKKGPPTDSESDESYSGTSEEEVYARPKQSTKKGPVKRNVRGRGTGYPPGQGRGTRRTSRGQSSSALADPLPDNDIDISHLENVMATVQCPTRDRRDPPMVNYKRGGNSVDHLRYSKDPAEVEHSFRGDSRFWFPHQADWYESVIMTTKHVTTEMKWIDWNYLKGLASPLKEVVDAVHDWCQEMDLLGIMGFSCDWNEEVVAQFYATLHISDCGRIFQFLI